MAQLNFREVLQHKSWLLHRHLPQPAQRITPLSLFEVICSPLRERSSLNASKKVSLVMLVLQFYLLPLAKITTAERIKAPFDLISPP